MRITAVAVLAVLVSVPVSAQTLAEASAAAKRVTHEWPVSANAVPVYDADKAAAVAVVAPSVDATPVVPTLTPVSKDEAYWKGRARTLDTTRRDDRTYLAAAHARVVVLEGELNVVRGFLAIATTRRALLDATADVSRLRATVANDTRAVADFELEAHRAGVPPGWLVLE
jgi:hypothetical protein